MARIMVFLDEAVCFDTEDVTGGDELYVVGAVKTSNGQTSSGFVTQPININDNQTLKFGPGGGFVFDQNLPDDSFFQVEMVVFDEDAARDVTRYDQARAVINQTLAVTPNPLSVIGSLPLDAVRLFMQLDQDDQLGADLEGFSVGQLPNGWSFHQWNAREDGAIGFSTWNYLVRYWIFKG